MAQDQPPEAVCSSLFSFSYGNEEHSVPLRDAEDTPRLPLPDVKADEERNPDSVEIAEELVNGAPVSRSWPKLSQYSMSVKKTPS